MASHILLEKPDKQKNLIVKTADIRMVKVKGEDKSLVSMVDNGIKVVVETTTPADVIRTALGRSFIGIKDDKGCTVLVRKGWIRKVVPAAHGGSTIFLPKSMSYVLHTPLKMETVYGLLI